MYGFSRYPADIPVSALRKDALGVPHIVFFVIAAAAPLTAVVGVTPAAFMLGNRPDVPATFILVGVLYLLFSVGFTAMSVFSAAPAASTASPWRTGPTIGVAGAMMSAIFSAEGVAYLPLGFVAFKAVVSAKFLMLRTFPSRLEGLIVSILRKSPMLLALPVPLTLIEEALLALIHGGPIAQAMAEMTGGSSCKPGTSLLIVLLILFPYGFRTLGEALA